MNMKQLVDTLHEKLGDVSPGKEAIRHMLRLTGIVIGIELVNGSDVELPLIGKLKVETRAARAGRNPQTGAAMAIAAKRVAKFAPSKALRIELNRSGHDEDH